MHSLKHTHIQTYKRDAYITKCTAEIGMKNKIKIMFNVNNFIFYFVLFFVFAFNIQLECPRKHMRNAFGIKPSFSIIIIKFCLLACLLFFISYK